MYHYNYYYTSGIFCYKEKGCLWFSDVQV